jgi:hypothetical protein
MNAAAFPNSEIDALGQAAWMKAFRRAFDRSTFYPDHSA